MEWNSPWLNESQIRPIDQSEQICKQSYVNVGFVYANINCRLKIHFLNNNKSFFDSMDDLILKIGGFSNYI